MKKFFPLFLVVLVSGCCATNSDKCGCEPPDPKLEGRAIAWIDPYKNFDEFVYADDNGDLDTLMINFEEDTQFCGGVECGSDCEVQRVRLQSRSNAALTLQISAKEQHHIVINDLESGTDHLVTDLDLDKIEIFVLNANTTVALLGNYDWMGQLLTVLTIDCTDEADCLKYEVTDMVVSEQNGLVQYRTKDGRTWNLVN